MKFRTLILTLGLSSLGSAGLDAQTSFWNVSNGTWSSGGNWTPSGPANNGTADVAFAVSGPAYTSTLDTSFSVNSVSINLGSGPFTLVDAPGAVLTIGSGGFTDGSGVNVDINPVMTGTMTLTQSGAGTLTLHAQNTYSGNTNVVSGTLQDGGTDDFSPNSLLNVGLLGTVNVSSNETTAGLNNFSGLGGSVVISSGATLFLSGSTSTSFSGVISGGGKLEQDALSTLMLLGNNTYTGTTTIGAGSTINLGGGGLTGSIASQTVQGSGSIVFDQLIGLGYGGNIVAGINVVQTAGTTTLSGVNTYTGPTTVNGGVLQAGSTTAFGSGSAVALNSSGSLNLNGFSNSVGSLTGGPSSSVTLGSGTLTINNPAAAATLYNGTISGIGGSLVMAGNVLDLTNANTYTGGTTVSAGTLEVDNPSGSGTGTGPITVMPGAVLQLGNGGADTNGSVNPGSAITDNGNVTFARADSIVVPNTFLGGTGGILMVGHGTLTLTGNNAYSGPTTVQFGTLMAGSSTAFGDGLSAVDVVANGILSLNGFSVTVGSIAGDATGIISLGSTTLTTGAANVTSTFGGLIQGTGNLIVVGTGTTILTGANTYSGGTTLPGTGSILQVGDGVTAGARIAGNVTDQGTLVFEPVSTDSIGFSGNISGAGAVTFSGAGTITLSGTNTYTGLTSVNTGTLADGAVNAFSPGSAMLVGTGGTLAVNHNETVAELQNGGAGGSISIANATSLSSLGSNYLSDVQATISGGGSFVVLGGVQGLSGNNTYTGGTSVQGIGELLVGSNTALGTGTLTFQGTATDLSPDTNITLANPIDLLSTMDNDAGGNNNLTLQGQISGPAGITWSSPGALTLMNGSNNFSGGVDMQDGILFAGSTGSTGTGTITLNSNTTLNIVNGVVVNNTLSLPGTAAVLAGNGTIATPVTANSAVVLSASASPGGGPGNLTFSGGLTLASGSAIDLNIYDAAGTKGVGYSLISATNGLNLTAIPSSITLNVASINLTGASAAAINFNPSTPFAWTFATSTSAITGFSAGQFNLLTTGFLNGTGGGTFSVTGTTNNLMLNFTPVPEPATWALLGAGVFAVIPFTLRRRRTVKV